MAFLELYEKEKPIEYQVELQIQIIFILKIGFLPVKCDMQYAVRSWIGIFHSKVKKEEMLFWISLSGMLLVVETWIFFLVDMAIYKNFLVKNAV